MLRISEDLSKDKDEKSDRKLSAAQPDEMRVKKRRSVTAGKKGRERKKTTAQVEVL